MGETQRNGRRVPVSRADEHPSFDHEADVVVVGAGAAGFAAAVTAAANGGSVILLEKGAAVGGTTLKSGAWYWIPNNRFLREAGTPDPKDDALRYMARVARPESYDAEDARFGLPADDHALLEAFYDHAAEAVEFLEAQDAQRCFHAAEIPDYYAQLPENACPTGRVLMPLAANGEEPGEGAEMIGQLQAGARRLGVRILCEHAVAEVVLNDADEVVGVVADTPAGRVRIRAAKAVVFGSGGFGQNPEMRRAYLSGPIFGSCAAPTCTGDFVSIASALGAPLANMNYPWLGPTPLERGLANDPDNWLMFEPAGDSMLMVNRYGHRVVDEKIQYNEITQVMWTWDPSRAEYPNLLLMMVWDQASQDRWNGDKWGNPIAPVGQGDEHVVRADTLGELADALRGRLHELRAHTGGYTLDDGFDAALDAAVERFNTHAADGHDPDFGRGNAPISVFFQAALGPAREGNEASPTVFALADSGPYYATIIAPGTLDTKGGPRINPRAQVLDAGGRPIPGLYGAGNCVASAAGKAYFAGGATIGPALTFGYLAGLGAVAEPVKELAARAALA